MGSMYVNAASKTVATKLKLNVNKKGGCSLAKTKCNGCWKSLYQRARELAGWVPHQHVALI